MMKQRKVQSVMVMVAALIAVLVIGVAVSAQDDAPPAAAPCGMTGQGMYGQAHGYGMLGGQSMLDITAQALGLDVEALWEALSSGKTIAEIAEAQGVELQAIVDARLEFATARVAAMVEAGVITQERADEMLTYMAENMLEHLTTGQGMSFGGNMMGRMHDGMMGRGGMGRGGMQGKGGWR